MKAIFGALYPLAVYIIGCKGDTLLDNQVFGPYILDITEFSTCETDNATIGLDVKIENMTDHGYKAYVHMTVRKPIMADELRIQVDKKDGNKKMLLYRHKILKPCTNLILKQTVFKYINVGPRCLMKKGHYNNEVDIYELESLFLGDHFYYGEYIATFTMFHEKRRIISCAQNIKITKKEEIKKKNTLKVKN